MTRACPHCGSTDGYACQSEATVYQRVTLRDDGELDYSVYESDDVEFVGGESYVCRDCAHEVAATADDFIEWMRS